MSDALFKLATWLSPAFPIGAFAYSHGLERAIHEGIVRDRASLTEWIGGVLAHGAGRTDAILLCLAWSEPADEGVAALAAALAPSAERLRETEAQGAAFSATTAAAWGGDPRPLPYPVAVGRAAAVHGLPLGVTVLFFLHAFASNLISAAMRLIPIGQTDGQRTLAELMPLCQSVAEEAMAADEGELGGCAIGADIASMLHETQPVRLFRS